MDKFRERHEWKKRLGRFRLCERDAPGMEQVMPGKLASSDQQTHTKAGDEYRDGAPENMDA